MRRVRCPGTREPRSRARLPRRARVAADRRRTSSRTVSPGRGSAHAAAATVKPSGMPPAAPFAVVKKSGVTPKCCEAHGVPSLPLPVWTSSKIRAAPCSVQASRNVSRKPAGGSTTPASDWIGSRMTAATRSVIAARAWAASPNGTRTTWNGVNGDAFLLVSVTAAAAAVRPWNAPENATTVSRPVACSAGLQRVLVRFGTAVRTEHVPIAGRQVRLERAQERVPRCVVDQVGDERELAPLLRQRGAERRVARAERQHAMAAVEIEHATSIAQDQRVALGAYDVDGQANVGIPLGERHPVTPRPQRGRPVASSKPSIRFRHCRA
jgi:hypothetical protein